MPALYHGLVASPDFGFSRRSTSSISSFRKTAPPLLTSSPRVTNNRFDIVGKIDKSFVVCRIDKDIAIIQDKRRIASEIAREIDNASGSILHNLRCILYFDVVTRTIAEKILHGIGAITDNNQEIPDARFPQPFDNVLQNRLATHLDHGFGKIDGQFAHPCASPSCEQNRFVYPCHESTR